MQSTTHAVGIDLGTTYSCIAYLDEHGKPVTIPNQEGELATPSVILVEDNEVIVGTEALRNAIARPKRVIQNSKRYMGDQTKYWKAGGQRFSPVDVAACILKKLIHAAQNQIGAVEHAVITVPAQFGDAQRHATIAAGHAAGLQRIDIINEPVSAALCYVLGSEGMWFSELAEEQRILVYDLGGGTFDLSLVKYQKDEVSVIAASGDLNLGGIDWNQVLVNHVGNQFQKEFGVDPRVDPESLQFLSLEAEQAKRSLSVRGRTALTCQHAGHRKSFTIEQTDFERESRMLVDRTENITRRLLKDNKMGWAHVDVVLTTGGSSRMPMIRKRLKKMSGTTLNTTLSPDQSIAHGATYYAGMLLSNDKFARSILSLEASERLGKIKQNSVTARSLGILVRVPGEQRRTPHYLIPVNSPLPASATQTFATVVPDQKRVHLRIVESGAGPNDLPALIGECVIDNLPAGLPLGSEVAVKISYDTQARVNVSAMDVTSGIQASTEIIRQQNLAPQLEQRHDAELLDEASLKPTTAELEKLEPSQPRAKPRVIELAPEEDLRPIPLCNDCAEPLDAFGKCPACRLSPTKKKKPAREKTKTRSEKTAKSGPRKKRVRSANTNTSGKPQGTKKRRSKKRPASPQASPSSSQPSKDDEDEFWNLVE